MSVEETEVAFRVTWPLRILFASLVLICGCFSLLAFAKGLDAGGRVAIFLLGALPAALLIKSWLRRERHCSAISQRGVTGMWVRTPPDPSSYRRRRWSRARWEADLTPWDQIDGIVVEERSGGEGMSTSVVVLHLFDGRMAQLGGNSVNRSKAELVRKRLEYYRSASRNHAQS